MKNRERFNANVNSEEEKRFSERIAAMRKFLKKLYGDLHNTGAIIEPCEYQLIWGSLCRCLICIESSVSLISQGYIGSANALLRQMYEFLLWSKLGIDADVDTLKKMNGYFYDKTLGKSYPVTYVLKHTDIPSIDNKIDEDAVRKEGQDVYHKYSYLTHATGLAQQNIYRQANFYWAINACLTEISTILDLFLIVFEQYCKKVIDTYLSENEELKKWIVTEYGIEEDGLFWAATHAGKLCNKIEKYRNWLVETQGITKKQIFKEAFLKQWTVHGEKMKNIIS